jgi:rhodanese-related sulfurtransferase
MAKIRTVGGAEAVDLVASGAVRVVDVRTPEEYETLGHIPDAALIPLNLILSAPAVLQREARPLLVCCEHGVRSVQAAQFLVEAGFPDVLNLSGGMSLWDGPRASGPGRILGPSPWLLENARLLPRGGEALDLACGPGRHALLLAGAGFAVRALDRDREAIERLRGVGQRLGLPLAAEVADLESPSFELPDAAYALIVVFRFLHRPLFPRLARALSTGGVLIYETYVRDGLNPPGVDNPDFLLEPGELHNAFPSLEILAGREGVFGGPPVAGIVARRQN